MRWMAGVGVLVLAGAAGAQGAKPAPRPAAKPAPKPAPRPSAPPAAAPAAPERPRLVPQVGVTGEVRSIGFSPDRQTFLTDNGTDQVTMWHVASGKVLRPYRVDWAGESVTVAFAPNGRFFARLGVNVRFWETATGRLLRQLPQVAGADDPSCVAFSPDSRHVWVGDWKGAVRQWEVATGRLLREFRVAPRPMGGDINPVNTAEVSPDGRTLVTSAGLVEAWDTATGARRMQFPTVPGGAARITADGRALIVAGKTTTLWSLATGRLVRDFKGPSVQAGTVGNAVIGVDRTSRGEAAKPAAVLRRWDLATGKLLHMQTLHRSNDDLGFLGLQLSADARLLVGADMEIRLWDTLTGKPLGVARSLDLPSNDVSLSPDGRFAATSGRGVLLWDLPAGRVARRLAEQDSVRDTDFAADGRLAVAGGDAEIFDPATGERLRTFPGHFGGCRRVLFLPGGDRLVTADDAGNLWVWDSRTGAKLRELQKSPPGDQITWLSCSADGRRLAACTFQREVLSWDTTTWTRTPGAAKIDGTWELPVAVAPDGRTLVTGGHEVREWDAATGRPGRVLKPRISATLKPGETPDVGAGYDFETTAVAYSPDGALLAVAGVEVELIELATGRRVAKLPGLGTSGQALAFSADGRWLVSTGWEGATYLWKVAGAGATESARLYAYSDGTWAVVDPEGRYDAANAGEIDGLHWVVRNEPVDLRQFKDGYYEPGLLAKLLGHRKEPIRPVPTLADLQLYPEVVVETPAKGGDTLTVRLRNRGGGMGPVEVYVNGKLALADARPPGFDARRPAAVLTVRLPREAAAAGRRNEVRVLARTERGDLVSRAAQAAWFAPGEETPEQQPRLWAVVAGTSTYAEPSLNLRYAAKDAADFARALALGAHRLFGAEATRVALLVSPEPGAQRPPGAQPVTRAAFKAAFDRIRKEARPEDVLVVYLAGHGVGLSGQGGPGTYRYLTQDARSAELAGSPFLAEWTLSSDELAEWTRTTKVLKQVLILDTCASGAAAQKLTERREVSGDQVRALERLKDRVGFHVLMGCAADAVSYEAGRYGQGLLTYALLQGMKGASLRNEEYVDVSRLFQHAADTVPQLAGSIGGIQRPQISAPRGVSFDLGRLTAPDRAQIPLAQARPQLLRPRLLNPDEGFDSLDLEPALRRALREAGFAGARGGSPVFVDADELPGAVRPSGTYTLRGDTVTVRLVLRRDTQTLGEPLVLTGARNDLPALVARLAAAVQAAVGEAGPAARATASPGRTAAR